MAIDRVGPARIILGTDVPGLLLFGTHRKLVDFANMHIEFLSEQDRHLIMGENAQQVYWK